MGNLDNLGVIVVVLLLAGIIVVSFVIDPEETPSNEPDRSLGASSGAGDGGDRKGADRSNIRQPSKRPTNRLVANQRNAEPGTETERSLRRSPQPGVAGRQPGTVRPQTNPPSGTRGRTERFVRTEPRVPGPNPQRPPKASVPVADAGRPAGAATPADRATSGFPRRVTLQQNESIWDIAVREYGTNLGARMVAKILKENGIANARKLKAGKALTLPAPARETLASARTTPRAGVARPASSRSTLPFAPDEQEYGSVVDPVSPAGQDGQRIYVVQSGDTLGEIAVRLLGSTRRVKAIMALNGLKNENLITEGMRLKIPAKR